MKKGRILALLCLGLFVMLAAAPAAHSETPAKDYIRLHILADSNSAWDQAVKLAVRDAVRAQAGALLEGCASPEEAWSILTQQTDRLQSAADSVLSQWHCEAEASVQTGVFEFPERVYGEETVPAGSYRAVRILLGRGEGRNWWCVLYPSLCLPEDADCETPVTFYSCIGRWLARLFGGDPA